MRGEKIYTLAKARSGQAAAEAVKETEAGMAIANNARDIIAV